MTRRQRLAVGVLAALLWASIRAGTGPGIINGRGWPSFARFFGAITEPEIAGEFLRLTADAAVTTMAYAILGTAVSLIIGAVGAFFLSELVWGRHPIRRVMRTVLVVPRAIHEILWALLLVQIFGFDPWVAVLAIGVPFGAVTAKVQAETIDEADGAAYRAIRATGAGRVPALFYSVLADQRGELTSYAFYRLECAIRAAAVLGVIGVGGLGFQLDLSFETLRYGEIWTLIAALMALSGLAEAWSSNVRRSTADELISRQSVAIALVLIPLSWIRVGLEPSDLWSGRTRSLAARLGGDLWPPRLGPGGLSELVRASIDSVAMSILAIALAAFGALVFGALSARPTRQTAHPRLAARILRALLRAVLLLLRAVPAPIWAFLMVLVLFPGMWPGAVALAVYNLGVLGRLSAEVFEDGSDTTADALAVSGAGHITIFFYATLPAVASRLVGLALYRWEVIVRETVVVGVVGAGGLGQLIRDHLAARDFAAVTGTLMAMVVIALAIDTLSTLLRRTLR